MGASYLLPIEKQAGISGFCRKVDENCTLLGYYPLVPSSGVRKLLTLENGTDRLLRNFSQKLPLLAA
jgi:hypothetical protein